MDGEIMELNGLRLTNKASRMIADELKSMRKATEEKKKFIQDCIEKSKQANSKGKDHLK